MKRVLITGASGFIGRAVVPLLATAGYEVHAVARETADVGAATFHRVDLLELGAVDKLIARLQPSHLLHLAWYAEPGAYWRSPQNLDWVAASLHLLRRFAEAGGHRAVLAGTCAEYLWGQPRLKEATSLCEPATLYGAAKDGLRRIAVRFAAEIDLSLAWGRIFYMYGPGEKAGRLVGDAVRALLAGERFATSEGRQRRDFLHVVDVAGAFAALLNCDVQGPVNIGSGQAVPIRRLLEIVADETGRPDLIDFGARPLPATEPDVVEAEPARLAHEVGFHPGYSLDRGLADTVAWWRAQGQSAWS